MKTVQVLFQFLTRYIVFYAFFFLFFLHHRESVAPRPHSRSQMFLRLSDVQCTLVPTQVFGAFDSLLHNVEQASTHTGNKRLCLHLS